MPFCKRVFFALNRGKSAKNGLDWGGGRTKTGPCLHYIRGIFLCAKLDTTTMSREPPIDLTVTSTGFACLRVNQVEEVVSVLELQSRSMLLAHPPDARHRENPNQVARDR